MTDKNRKLTNGQALGLACPERSPDYLMKEEPHPLSYCSEKGKVRERHLSESSDKTQPCHGEFLARIDSGKRYYWSRHIRHAPREVQETQCGMASKQLLQERFLKTGRDHAHQIQVSYKRPHQTRNIVTIKELTRPRETQQCEN